MHESSELGIHELKQMGRWLYKYDHLCDLWDQKKISIKDYASRMTQLEWKINQLVHYLQSQSVPIEVVFYRNMDPKRIQYLHDGRDVTADTFAGLFM